MPEQAASDEAPLNLAGAIGTIDRATGFVEPLRRRTEGVTIVLWGFVSACVILSNSLLDDVYGFYDAGGWKRVVSSLLWLPWTALGIATTISIWRIAEVHSRAVGEGKRRSVPVILAWLAVFLGIVLLVAVFPVAAPGLAIVLGGAIWLAIGLLDMYAPTAAGRRTITTIGVLVILIGIAFGAATYGSADGGWDSFEIPATLALGVIPIIGGLSQALRG